MISGVSTGVQGWQAAAALIILVILGISSLNCVPSLFDATIDATVVNVVDGDTIDVTDSDGTKVRIRILGIDAPELSGNRSDEYGGIRDTECLDDWGAKVKELVTKRLGCSAWGCEDGKKVKVELDPAAGEYDQYDRLLAYVYLYNNDLGTMLLEEGMARVWEPPPDIARIDDYFNIEEEARSNREGLWACTFG